MTQIPMGKIAVGTCGRCAGPVCVHAAWACVIPDVPTCACCGAVRADSYGPVLPMRDPFGTATVTGMVDWTLGGMTTAKITLDDVAEEMVRMSAVP